MDSPTEKQLKYAADLGIKLSGGESKSDLTELIRDARVAQNPAPVWLLEYGEELGIGLDGLTKSELYREIFSELLWLGDDYELSRWFAYRVLRDRLKNYSGLDVPFGSSMISDIAGQISLDPKVAASIRRYETVNFFGPFTSPGGVKMVGGSRNTIAYRAVLASLELLADKTDSEKTQVRADYSHIVAGVEASREAVANKAGGELDGRVRGLVIVAFAAAILFMLVAVLSKNNL